MIPATIWWNNTPALAVSAMTLAAFALIELGAVAQARPLAQRALMLTRLEALFDQLPIALSCAAAVDSVGGEFDRAEGFHLEALARARQAADLDPVQMALCNLLSSHIAILRDAALQGDAALVATVEHRSRPHVVHARHLKDDPRLAPVRPVPGGVAAYAWASTLFVTSYWLHPAALGHFPGAELAWMVASPLALAAVQHEPLDSLALRGDGFGRRPAAVTQDRNRLWKLTLGLWRDRQPPRALDHGR